MCSVLQKYQLLMPDVHNALYPFNPSLEDEMKRLFDEFRRDTLEISHQQLEDVMEEFRHNGRDFEYCPELEKGAVLVPNIRRKKNKKPLPTECVFCKNNGERESYYQKHYLKDAEGKVYCPVLRAYKCPICGVDGDYAHTIKYCPKNKNPELISIANALKTSPRNSSGRRRSLKTRDAKNE